MLSLHTWPASVRAVCHCFLFASGSARSRTRFLLTDSLQVAIAAAAEMVCQSVPSTCPQVPGAFSLYLALSANPLCHSNTQLTTLPSQCLPFTPPVPDPRARFGDFFYSLSPCPCESPAAWFPTPLSLKSAYKTFLLQVIRLEFFPGLCSLTISSILASPPSTRSKLLLYYLFSQQDQDNLTNIYSLVCFWGAEKGIYPQRACLPNRLCAITSYARRTASGGGAYTGHVVSAKAWGGGKWHSQ